MKKYRFFLLGLVHLPVARKYSSCAFTIKNIRMAKFLCDLGHEVYLFGARSTEEEPLENYINSPNFYFVETHSIADIQKDYGVGDNRYELGYPWKNVDYKHDMSSERKPSTLKFYIKTINYINKIKKPDDFLLCTQGQYHKPIADAVKLYLTVESSIGYRGWVESMFHSFESNYIRNFLYGSQFPFASVNGRYYDRTIPNWFDPNDYEFSDKKDDYFLFIGRMIKRKGVLTAYLATKATKDKLIFAGQGAYVKENGYLVDNDPQEYAIAPDSDWEFIGFADVENRKKLMSRAKAVFVATEYLECFGGVNIEARLSGTPVITTDFGCFPQYIENGLDGFRCNTLQDFVDAVNKCKKFTKEDYQRIRKRAEKFLMDNVAKEYQKWFSQLYQVYLSTDGKTKGWGYLK
jgi:glycosyltransferase involved in cell wall biosynthesis